MTDNVIDLVQEAEPVAVEPDSTKRSVATDLVDIVTGRYRLGVSLDGAAFAVEIGGPPIARTLRGSRESLRAELAAVYADRTEKAASSNALADALLVVEGRALRAEPEPVCLRSARLGDRLVLDLGRPDGQALIIGPDGWNVDISPVVFRRTALTAALPDPAAPGDLEFLKRFLLINDDSWPQLLAWLVSALDPDVAHAVLALLGQQGTGKSVRAKTLASIIDPSTAPLRSAPRDITSWSVAASGSYVVPIDNVSTIPVWFSDALCRAATGDGFVSRKLYTDDDISVLAFRRNVILTSIDPGATRGDLGDRLVTIESEPIGSSIRRSDDDLDTAWATAWPHVLAGLADLAVEVLQRRRSVTVDQLPRMADYYRTLATIDDILNTDGCAAYSSTAERTALDVLDADDIGLAVVDHMIGRDEPWAGTVAQLLHTLDAARGEGRAPKGWPGTPKALGGSLRRVAPALLVKGITVEFGKHTRDGYPVTLTNKGIGSDVMVTTVTEPRDRDHGDRQLPTDSLALCSECGTRPGTRTSGANRAWCAPCWDDALAVNLASRNGTNP